MTPQELTRLLQRAAGNDLLSLEVLYQELRSPVYAEALAITRNSDDAYEVTRETFAGLFFSYTRRPFRDAKRWMIRSARRLAKKRPKSTPSPVSSGLTLDQSLLRQAFFRLSEQEREILLLTVSGCRLHECARMLRIPPFWAQRKLGQSMNCLARVLEIAPRASVSDHPEGQVKKLLKSALSLLEAPSLESICEGIKHYAGGTPQKSPVYIPAVIGAVAALCVLSGAIWSVWRGGPEVLQSVYMAEQGVSAIQENEPFAHIENKASGALLYNVVPSCQTARAALYDAPAAKEEQEAGVIKAGGIGPGLAYYTEKHGEDGAFNVVISAPDLTESARRSLQASSLLVLENDNYYYRLTESQIQYLSQQGLTLELAGSGKPARPQGIPENVDDATAFIIKNMGVSETTRVSYEITITANAESEALSQATAALQNCGITEILATSLMTQDSEAPSVYVYQSAFAATGFQILCLAQSEPESIIVTAAMDPPLLDAEKDYYYRLYGDGWVMK